MYTYIFKRLALMLPTLLGMLSITFLLTQLLPGGPAEQLLAQQSVHEAGGQSFLQAGQARQLQAEQLAYLNGYYGFDKPWHERYFTMLSQYAQFNLGDSYFHRQPVLDLILSKLPVSISLGLSSLLLAYSLSIGFGLYQVKYAEQKRGFILQTLLLILHAMPAFVLAILLIALFAGGHFLQWFPLKGLSSFDYVQDAPSLWHYCLDYAWHLVLPVGAMVLTDLAVLSQLIKFNMLEEHNKHYVQVLKAQGLPAWRFNRYILKNAMLPLIASIPATVIMALFSSSLLIETLFSLDGLGLMAYEAMQKRDYPVILGSLYLFSLLGLLAKILTDVLMAYLDPRVKESLLN